MPPSLDPLAEAFAQLLTQWEDSERHQAFLSLAVSLDQLPQAAGLYRTLSEAEPDRRERAQKQLSTITALALANLTPTEAETIPGRRWVMGVGLLVAGLMFAFATYALVQMLRAP